LPSFESLPAGRQGGVGEVKSFKFNPLNPCLRPACAGRRQASFEGGLVVVALFILSINYVKVKAEILDYFPPARPASLGEAGEADQPLADIILFLSRHFIFYSWWAGSRFSGDII